MSSRQLIHLVTDRLIDALTDALGD